MAISFISTQGIQTRPLVCIREDDQSVVSTSSCKGLEGPSTQQSCNAKNCPAL